MAARLPVASTNRRGRFDLRAHRPGRERARPQFGDRDLAQTALVGGPPPFVDGIHVGGHHEQVGVDLPGEQLAGEVLVDHGLDAAQRALLAGRPCGGDAAASGADHHDALVEQPTDRSDLEDPFRRRRGDDAAEMVAVALEHPTLLRDESLGGRVVVDRSHELGRVGEGRVGGVDLDHREQRRQGHLGRQDVAELLLDEVADHALGLRTEHVERIRLDVLVRRGLQREQSDLGSVAVRQDELMLLGDRREGTCGDADVASLGVFGHRLPALEERVAAERDQNSHAAIFSSPASRPATP